MARANAKLSMEPGVLGTAIPLLYKAALAAGPLVPLPAGTPPLGYRYSVASALDVAAIAAGDDRAGGESLPRAPGSAARGVHVRQKHTTLTELCSKHPYEGSSG